MPDLAKFLKNRLSGASRVAVLGIGSELRADDAAGLLVVQELEKRTTKKRTKPKLKIFFGSTAPENLSGEIKKFKPSHLIMVDTVEMKEKPGTILALNTSDIGGGVAFSTHKMPAKVLADYLLQSLACEVLIIGIQPSSIEFGKPASRHIKESAAQVAKAIHSSL